MIINCYGNKNSTNILIQMVDDHDLEVIESEVATIESATTDFCLITIKVNYWNHDLSPWKADAVFGNDDFTGRTSETLQEILELRHDGAYYEVNPWALFWDNDKYYMVAYDFNDRKIKHYRADKMLNAYMIDKKCKGVKAFEKLNKSTYTQKHFGMFGGEEVTVTLECTNDMANVIIDRFGRNIDIKMVDDEKFRVDVDVVMSDKFLAWVIALGGKVKVVAPEGAVEKIRKIKKSL